MNYAEHVEQLSHDSINRYLRDEKLTPSLVWEQTQSQLEATDVGYIVFDDIRFCNEYKITGGSSNFHIIWNLNFRCMQIESIIFYDRFSCLICVSLIIVVSDVK